MNNTNLALIEQCLPYLTAPELPELKARELASDLIERYNEKGRRHHVVAHLQDMAGFLIKNVNELHNPRPVFWAKLGHDSIYRPENLNGLNERLSADLTTDMLRPHLPAEEVRLVDLYIRTTADHQWDGTDTDMAYFLDADMKILGAPPDEFDEYDNNIRQEYSIYEDEIYVPGRIHALQGFLDQPRIFITDAAYEQFEAHARENIQRKIGELAV